MVFHRVSRPERLTCQLGKLTFLFSTASQNAPLFRVNAA